MFNFFFQSSFSSFLLRKSELLLPCHEPPESNPSKKARCFSYVHLSSFLFCYNFFMNFYLKLRDLRKYFFSKLIVWLKFTKIFLILVFLIFCALPNKDDYSDYTKNIIDYEFALLIYIFFCFALLLIEAFLRFIKRKYILKKEAEHIPYHKSKRLNLLDNIYTIFFILMLFYAFLTTFIFIFLP